MTSNTTESGTLAAGTSGVYATLTNSSPSIYGGGTNSAWVQATYVFSGFGVSNGTVQFDLTASGTLLPGTNGRAQMEFEYYGGAWSINGASQPSQTALLASGVSNLVLAAPIVNGVVDLQFLELASATCGGGNCTSTVDFLDPFSISGASAFDSNGNPVAASFVSESGFNPNAAAVVPTPEPSSLVLLGTGLLGVAGAARRRLMS